MTFSKGPYSISITRMTDKEKRPGLYVGSMNEYCHSFLKVGTFANDSRTEDFCRMLLLRMECLLNGILVFYQT